MNNSNHTRGPWQVDGQTVRTAGPPDRSSRTIADLGNPRGQLDVVFQANAALISAAPEMVEALEVVDALLSSKPDYGPGGITGFEADALATVRQALYKARGGPK